MKTLNACKHPNIMSVFQLMEDDEKYYIVSELAEGGELFDMIVDKKNPYSPIVAG